MIKYMCMVVARRDYRCDLCDKDIKQNTVYISGQMKIPQRKFPTRIKFCNKHTMQEIYMSYDVETRTERKSP